MPPAPMSPKRAPAPARRTGAMSLAAILVAAAALATPVAVSVPATAQDAEPEAAAPAPAAKPKPKPKIEPKPKPAATQDAAGKSAQKAAPGSSPWPAGATSVSESYGDWTVSCVKPQDRPACIVVQSQGDSKTGQRKFGFELSTPKDGRSEGVVLMPFGLSIEAGIAFKLDEQNLGKGAPYASCSAEGCMVPISFPTLATDGMRAAKTLTVTGQKANSSEPAVISVPLMGFPAAFDRAVALGG